MRERLARVYEGWYVVGASGFIVFLVAASFLYGFGTIFNSVRDEFGWSAGATAIGFSVRSEVGGIASPLVGYLIDRLGPRRMLGFGIVLAAAGVFFVSMMHSLWQFYAAMLVIAIGTTASGGQVAQAAIATWFRRRRARAMSFMTIGAGLGGTLVTAVAFLVEEFGWRAALRVLALIILVIGLTASRFVRERPADHPQPMDGIALLPNESADGDYAWGAPVREAIRSRAFILFSLAIVASQFAVVAFVIHQIPYLESSLGLSKTVAGSTVAVFTLTSIVGRLGFGYLADMHEKRYVLAAALSLITAGLLVLALAGSLWQVILAIALIAPGFGGLVPVRPAMLADYFGTRNFGQINGWGRLVFTTGGALGGWAVGFVFDQTGGYTLAWALAAGVVALSIPAMLAARPPDELMARYRRPPAAVPLGAAGEARR